MKIADAKDTQAVRNVLMGFCTKLQVSDLSPTSMAVFVCDFNSESTLR